MQNIAGNLVEMLSRIAFPKVGIIDIIQIALIAFFCISVHGMDKIYPCLYPAERNSGSSPVYPCCLYLQDEYHFVDFFQSGQHFDRRCDRYIPA